MHGFPVALSSFVGRVGPVREVAGLLEERRLIDREPNPADARSVMICLLPAGRRAIEDAAPQHVHDVRRHFIDLFTPAELDTIAALNERVLHHLAEESLPEEPTPGVPALPH